jgi:hypothetical protein
MMISRIGERKRENNLVLLMQGMLQACVWQNPDLWFQTALDVLALNPNPRIVKCRLNTAGDILRPSQMCRFYSLAFPCDEKRASVECSALVFIGKRGYSSAGRASRSQ